MTWLDNLVDEYYQWLRKKTILKEDSLTGWTMIDTPFIGLFNDTLMLYAKKEHNRIIISDDGETIHNLELCGASITRSPKRKELIDKIIMNYGIKIKDKELIIEADESNFVQKKHNFISAVSELNDFYLLSKHTISSIFRDDVKTYLDSQEIVYTPQFISRGSTGIEFTFDFQIAYKEKEIVIKTFNTLNKFNLPHFLFTWADIKESRERITGKSIVGLAIINNEEKEIKSEYLNALDTKGASYFLWSDRYKKESVKKLSAYQNN